MKEMAKAANLPEKRLANTSVRKSLVQNMTDHKVYVTADTGHKNSASLNNYRTLNDRHKYAISNILSNTSSTSLAIPAQTFPTATHTFQQQQTKCHAESGNQVTAFTPVSQERSDSRIDSLFAGSYMNNCQVTVNITTHAPPPKRRRIMAIESDSDSD